MGLSHHELFYYWKKISLLKRNEHYEILSRSMKTHNKTYNNINNISWLLKHTCVKKAYQAFVAKFLSAFGCVSPIRILRVKSNAKPSFDTDVLNTFWNRDKHCKIYVFSAHSYILKKKSKNSFIIIIAYVHWLCIFLWYSYWYGWQVYLCVLTSALN